MQSARARGCLLAREVEMLGRTLLILVLALSTVGCSGTLKVEVVGTPTAEAGIGADVDATVRAGVTATLAASEGVSTPAATAGTGADMEATVQAAVAATLAADEAVAEPSPTSIPPTPSPSPAASPSPAPRAAPTLLYSTFFGGGEFDEVHDLAVDGEGNVYIVGRTSSPDLPVTAGAYDGTHNGSDDMFVAKLSPDGRTLLYSTYLGGSDSDAGTGIAVDGEGNVYVTGDTWSGDFPVTPDAVDTMLDGGQDAFVVKLSAAGDELIYSAYLGGDSDDAGHCIAVDDAGSAYVGGSTYGFPVTPGAAQTTVGGLLDGFVARLSPDGGSLIYATHLGGLSYEIILGIAIDQEGNAYLATSSPSSNFPTTPGAYDTVCEGCLTAGSDAVAAKLSADGSEFLYSTFVGGPDSACHGEGFTDVAIDRDGNAYFVGDSCSADYPTTQDAMQPVLRGGRDVVVTKLNADGSDLLYSTYLGGAGIDSGLGIALDDAGNAYVAGTTYSIDFPTAFPAQSANGGGRDAFIVELNQDASALLFGTYLGGSSDEFEHPFLTYYMGFGVTSSGVYLAGATGSTDLPTTASTYDASFNGGRYDGFVAHLDLLNRAGVEPTAVPAAPTVAALWEWVPATSMTVPRVLHSATLLPDGRVLLIAGSTRTDIMTTNAEVYDPVSRAYQSIASLNTGRLAHTATLLPDNRILVIAGYNNGWLTDAEIYDPASDQWGITQPIFPHGSDHTATLLQDGRVLVVAGCTGSATPTDDRVEIFDPSTNRWQAAAPHAKKTDCWHTATLLADGRVLVAGGGPYAEPSIYDPSSDTWQPAGSLAFRRGMASVVQLQDGRVLLIGGADPVHADDPMIWPVLNSVEVYDPATNTWQQAAPMAEARFGHTATLLPDGRVLVIGGATVWDNPPWDGHEILSSVEIYDPDTNTWSSLPSLRQARARHTATLLPDGRVFVAGGQASGDNILASTEIIRPGSD